MTTLVSNGNSMRLKVSGSRLYHMEDVIYYLSFAIYLCQSVLSQTAFVHVDHFSFNAFKRMLMVVAASLLCLKIVLQMRKGGMAVRFMLGLVMTALSSVLLLRTRDMELFWIVLFVLASREANLLRLSRLCLIVELPILVAAVVCARWGIIPTYYMLWSSRGLRSSMGFIHPNLFAACLFNICLAHILFNEESRTLRNCLTCAAGLLVNYFTAKSSTVQIAFVLLALLEVGYNGVRSNRKAFAILALAALVICAGGSMYLMASYDPSNQLHYALNQLVHDRFRLGHDMYLYAKPSLFGNDYSAAPVQGYSLDTGKPITLFVDNSYIRLVLRFGVMGFAVVMLPLLLALLKASVEGTFNEAILGVLVFAVIGVTESYFIDFDKNYFLIIAAAFIFRRPVSAYVSRNLPGRKVE